VERAKSCIQRCAVYTRKSSEEGLEQDFNSLQAQREACETFIKSQAGGSWRLVKTAYDDGGISGGTMERPALQRLLLDIDEGTDRRCGFLQSRSADPLAGGRIEREQTWQVHDAGRLDSALDIGADPWQIPQLQAEKLLRHILRTQDHEPIRLL
jgi:hypothetical protein